VKARCVASIILAAAIALCTSGCTLFAPQSTINQYDPSDGVSGSVGSIDIRNAVLISNDGMTANLVVSLVNTGTHNQSVEIQYKTGAGRVTNTFQVAAGQSTELGGTSQPSLILYDIDTTPGGLFPVFFQYGNETGTQLLIPVLTSALPEYNNYAPTTPPAA
jgi:hypothetical protein